MRVRYAHTREPADLDRAIEFCEEAVTLVPSNLSAWPQCFGNLAGALAIRYERVGRLSDLEQAIKAREQAWSMLQDAFIAIPVAYKLGQQREWVTLHRQLVDEYLQLATAHPPVATVARRRALEIAEASKSRLLTELVGRGELPTPPAISPQQAARERKLLEDLTTIDTMELVAHGRPMLTAEETGGAGYEQQPQRAEPELATAGHVQRRQTLVHELQELWHGMAAAGPEATEYVALRRGDAPTWDDLARQVGDLESETALLSLFTTDGRTLLSIVRTGWDAPAIVEADLSAEAWDDILRRFSREIHARRRETWDRPLQPLFAQATPYLAGLRRVVFAPHARGHLLPWSVVAERAGWRTADGHPLPLVTLPALGLLPRLRHRLPSQPGPALVVGNPLGDLIFAEQEARETAAKLGTLPVFGGQATRETVLSQLAGASIVHLATHAYFAPGSPLDSGILLADGVLTAREIMGQRLHADLLVLSACETGVAGSLGGEELAGLAQAFLQAGARSLLVSLWKVDDPVTAVLMTNFYEARRARAENAEALSRAMAQVRAHEEWRHSYYWGAFVLMGDW